MIQLRLFRAAAPFQQLDMRELEEGALTIGRDPSAQWSITDPECELSRQHCVIALRGDRLWLRDVSANGVYVGPERRRLPRDVEHELDHNEPVHLGQFMIVLDPVETPANETARVFEPFDGPFLHQSEVTAEAFEVRSEWAACDTDVQPAKAVTLRPLSDATLLDAFCAGAGLDASSFIGDDPAQVMQRLGAAYRQTVLGLGDLLSERSHVKSDLSLDRTTVRATGNNPFKWAPTRRVAIDLLRERKDGFLSGSAALKASFEDIKKHVLCLMAGSRAAVSAVFDQLDPAQIEEEAKSQSMFGLNKGETCWRIYQRRHAQLAREARESAENPVNAAFKRGYERQARDLTEIGTRS